MTTPGKLAVGSNGHLTGPANLTYNNPFPCVNGSWGSGAMSGVVMHTMVGNLPGTIAVFNQAGFNASAHFGIAQDGQIHQFGPIGKGWIAWHAMAANQAWYGIEHADNGNPDTPLTAEQITASAQVVECLSNFAGFPLQEANTPAERGYGVHYMGGAAWGGHTCPDVPPAHVRSAQRPAILTLAAAIRGGHPAPSKTWKEWDTAGQASLAELAAKLDVGIATLLSNTVKHYGYFDGTLGNYIKGVFEGTVKPTDPMPKGCRLWVLA